MSFWKSIISAPIPSTRLCRVVWCGDARYGLTFGSWVQGHGYTSPISLWEPAVAQSALNNNILAWIADVLQKANVTSLGRSDTTNNKNRLTGQKNPSTKIAWRMEDYRWFGPLSVLLFSTVLENVLMTLEINVKSETRSMPQHQQSFKMMYFSLED